MNYWKFLLYTTIGAGAWHTILALMGWYMHAVVPENELEATIEQYNHYIVYTIFGLLFLAIIWMVVKHRK